MDVDSAEAFAERLLLIIDEGRRITTYKLALLTALINACAEGAGIEGHAPTTLHTRVIARHVLRLYLPQARSYLASDGAMLELRQITGPKASVVGDVLRLHLIAESARTRGFDAIEREHPEAFNECLDKIEYAFARNPLPRLQVVGKQNRPFMFDIKWSESVTLNQLHAPGGGLVELRRGAGDHLVRLAPLLRPLIALHWTKQVASINRINLEDTRLQDHLFGATRSTFPPMLRSGLSEMQQGCCFYCGSSLASRTQVDHVLPWSRWPNDAIENLVLADQCNGHKSDYFPALPHMDRWADRIINSKRVLNEIAESCDWESNPNRSLSLARSCYGHLRPGTPLWLRANDFTFDDPALVSQRLALLPA